MVNTYRIYEQLRAGFPKEAAEALAHVLSEVAEQLERTVTRDDFAELKQIVRDLAAAQQRTEQRVEELAAAQQRTEQRVEELAAAQQRTEQRVEELAQAQKRTEERVEELARTVDRGFQRMESRMGVLGARWGPAAEAAFRAGLLEVVRELGYTVEEYQGQDPEGFIDRRPRSYELDVLVHDSDTVVAEIKSSAGGPDVTEFARAVELFERQTGRRVTRRILVAVMIRPEAVARAQEHGVTVATDFSGLGA
jgi:hypothetical protein